MKNTNYPSLEELLKPYMILIKVIQSQIELEKNSELIEVRNNTIKYIKNEMAEIIKNEDYLIKVDLTNYNI